MPYWPHMREWLTFTRRLSYLLSQGVHRCDVGILYPVAPVEADTDGKQAVDTAFEFGRRLFSQGIDFDFIDFESLARAKIEDGCLKVSGEEYRVLVMPGMKSIRYSTLTQARRFHRGGGTVVALRSLPEASDRIGRSDRRLDMIEYEVFGAMAEDVNSGAAFSSRSSDAGGLGIFISTPASADRRARAERKAGRSI